MLSGLCNPLPPPKGRDPEPPGRRGGVLRYLVLIALGCLLVWAFSGCAVDGEARGASRGPLAGLGEWKCKAGREEAR